MALEKKACLAAAAVCLLTLTGCAGGPQVRDLERRVSHLERRITDAAPAQETASTSARPPMEVVVASEAPRPRRDPATLTDRDVQRALRAAGYYTGAIDGKVGPLTIRAIRDFQRDHGLKVDGVAGRNTKRALVDNIDW